LKIPTASLKNLSGWRFRIETRFSLLSCQFAVLDEFIDVPTAFCTTIRNNKAFQTA